MSDQLCANTIRCLAADTVDKAKSGHPGMPMGMAPLAHMLWSKYLNYNPSNPKWVRDSYLFFICFASFIWSDLVSGTSSFPLFLRCFIIMMKHFWLLNVCE
jgi:hypothetical protein